MGERRDTIPLVVTATVSLPAEKLGQIDRLKEGVAGQRGGGCAGQKLGGYRLDKTESPPTSELEVPFEQWPRQMEKSKSFQW